MFELFLAATLLAPPLPLAPPQAPAAHFARAGIFDPEADLEGFREASLGVHGRLYRLRPFLDAKGRELSDSERAALVQQWNAERDRVANLVTKINSDPREAFAHELEWRMAKLSVFDRAGLERVDGKGGTVYYIEMPLRGADEARAALVEQLDPWMVRMEELFGELYGDHMGLEARPGLGGHAVCVLGSRKQFMEFARLIEVRPTARVNVVYDPELQLTVTYRDTGDLAEALRKRRTELLHGQVQSLLASRCKGELESWLRFGVAGFLAEHDGNTPNALNVRTFNFDWVSNVSRLLEPEARAVFFPSLSELPKHSTARSVEEWVTPRYRKRSGRTIREGWVAGIHKMQSAALVHFLHRGAKGQYARGFRDYLGQSLAGAGGAVALARCMGVTHLAPLDEEFALFLIDRWDRRYPQQKVASLGSIFDSGQKKAAASTRAAAAKPSRGPRNTGAAAEPAKPKAAALQVPPPTGFQAVAVASDFVQHGALGGARETLEEWLSKASDQDPDRKLIERELERLERFTELRAMALEALVTRGKKLSLKLPRGKLIAQVSGVEKDRVRLGRNRLGLDELVLDDVPAAAWTELMVDRKRVGLELEPAMILPLAMAGEEALASAPKRMKIPESWRLSARLDYPEARADLDLQVAMERVASLDLSTDASPTPADLRAFDLLLLSGDAGSNAMDEQVAARRETLLALGAQAVRADVDQRPLEGLLEGQVEAGEDGDYAITWDFEAPEQMLDFRHSFSTDIYPTDAIVGALNPDDPFRIQGGALEGSGSAALTSILQLDASELLWSCVVNKNEDAERGWGFELSVGSREASAFVSAQSLCFITVRGPSGSSTAGEARGATYGKRAMCRLYKDDAGWHLFVDGTLRATVAIEAPRVGHVRIASLSEASLEVDELTVRGKVSKNSLTALRKRVAARELASRGWSVGR